MTVAYTILPLSGPYCAEQFCHSYFFLFKIITLTVQTSLANDLYWVMDCIVNACVQYMQHLLLLFLFQNYHI